MNQPDKFKVGDRVITHNTDVGEGVIVRTDHGFSGVEKYYRIKLDKPHKDYSGIGLITEVGRSERELELCPNQ